MRKAKIKKRSLYWPFVLSAKNSLDSSVFVSRKEAEGVDTCLHSHPVAVMIFTAAVHVASFSPEVAVVVIWLSQPPRLQLRKLVQG